MCFALRKKRPLFKFIVFQTSFISVSCWTTEAWLHCRKADRWTHNLYAVSNFLLDIDIRDIGWPARRTQNLWITEVILLLIMKLEPSNSPTFTPKNLSRGHSLSLYSFLSPIISLLCWNFSPNCSVSNIHHDALESRWHQLKNFFSF